MLVKYSLFTNIPYFIFVCVVFASEVELFALSLLHFIVFISDYFSDLWRSFCPLKCFENLMFSITHLLGTFMLNAIN